MLGSKEIVFLISMLILPACVMAQYVESNAMLGVKKLKATQVNFGLGGDNDHYSSMSLDHLMMMAKNPDEMYRDLGGFDEEIMTSTAGGAFYANVGFAPLDPSTGTYREDREIQFGMGLHFPKEAMVSFKNPDLDTSIVYCNLHMELSVNSSYLLKGRWGKKFMWYAGVGMSAGASFNNKMILISSTYYEPGEHPPTEEELDTRIETFDARSIYYTRIFLPYGIHYQVGRDWQVGFDFRTGVGAQFIEGKPADFIRKTGAFILGARYLL